MTIKPMTVIWVLVALNVLLSAYFIYYFRGLDSEIRDMKSKLSGCRYEAAEKETNMQYYLLEYERLEEELQASRDSIKQLLEKEEAHD